MKFLKAQATGNDFLILDARQTTGPKTSLRPALAKKHCNRLLGFGADGFLVLENKSDGIHWDFYNSDGSSANMCGNAARAVTQYLLQQGQTNEVAFFTQVGKVLGKKRSGHEVEVQFDLPNSKPESVAPTGAILLNTGVPHVVLKVAHLDDRNHLRTIGNEIKARYKQQGMNVTFYSPHSPTDLEAVTFERGVEDFTLSCGTGALAAARVHLGEKIQSCTVHVPGGNLHVTFQGNRAILVGEARTVGWCTPIEEE